MGFDKNSSQTLIEGKLFICIIFIANVSNLVKIKQESTPVLYTRNEELQ